MTWAIAGAGAVGGAIIGSFLATVCIRWPEGKQALRGRSRCDNCGRALGAVDLVPIVSALATGFRCRTCGDRIAPLHLLVEIAAAALVAVAVVLQPNVHGLALAAFWLLLLAPAVLDARHFWLPDALTALLAVAGLALGGLATGAALSERLAGGAVGFLALAAVAFSYAKVRGRQGMGAGDPKLLGAIGLWTGWAALPFIVVVAALAGLSLAIARRHEATHRLPFGTLLAIGAVAWTGLTAAEVVLVD